MPSKVIGVKALPFASSAIIMINFFYIYIKINDRRINGYKSLLSIVNLW